ncbi:hypothetical protein [Pseudomonas urmiensis]|uniref:hypothetical protein n=1 Tax=Pseudomonas urmiensis TaxID=2745493 RepID=UPI003D0D048A
MLPRFVIVPALPIEQEHFRQGIRHFSTTISGGFDIYDNQEKLRLKPSYPTRARAETACVKMNLECPSRDELFPPPQTC